MPLHFNLPGLVEFMRFFFSQVLAHVKVKHYTPHCEAVAYMASGQPGNSFNAVFQ